MALTTVCAISRNCPPYRYVTPAAAPQPAAVAPQFVPVAELGDIRQLHFTLEINGEVRQRGYTGDMIFGVDELLSHVSRYITYRTGDLFFTGTPAGAGPIERGDVLRATLEGRELLNFEIR